MQQSNAIINIWKKHTYGKKIQKSTRWIISITDDGGDDEEDDDNDYDFGAMVMTITYKSFEKEIDVLIGSERKK